MSPRALTEQEKEIQRQKLMIKGRELILALGVKKVSVDDIAKAAGMAKGSFYHYFASKEDLLMQLVWGIYQGFIMQAHQVIGSSTAPNMRHNVGGFIRSILHDADKVFFFINHNELEELLAVLNTGDVRGFNQLERGAFANLIELAGLNTQTVKPEVVHNYIHAMYFATSDDSMIPEYLDETIEAMLEGLLNYVFGKEGNHGK